MRVVLWVEGGGWEGRRVGRVERLRREGRSFILSERWGFGHGIMFVKGMIADISSLDLESAFWQKFQICWVVDVDIKVEVAESRDYTLRAEASLKGHFLEELKNFHPARYLILFEVESFLNS